MKNKKPESLKHIKKILGKRYYVGWTDWNILEVSADPETQIFAFILFDPELKDGVIISMAMDFPDPFITADLCIQASYLSKLYLGEGFYITNDEQLLWGESAQKAVLLDSDPILSQLEPMNKLLN